MRVSPPEVPATRFVDQLAGTVDCRQSYKDFIMCQCFCQAPTSANRERLVGPRVLIQPV